MREHDELLARCERLRQAGRAISAGRYKEAEAIFAESDSQSLREIKAQVIEHEAEQLEVAMRHAPLAARPSYEQVALAMRDRAREYRQGEL